jgi:monovalent cation/hydrogen antiporter
MHLELIIFFLLVVIAGLGVVARVIRVPYPILLVIAGLALGFLPGMPRIELPPDLVLLIFLPPLLYGAAFFTSLRDLRAAVRPITLNAVGLVILTMGAVAAAAHLLIGLPWAVAFVLGAIVSPTDPVAPATILRQIGAPRRLITVIEGENLTNDWTALVLYRFAVAAVLSGTFSLWEAGGRFVLTGIGGLAIGLAVGWVIRAVRRRIDDPQTEITISILSGYAAYLPAEQLGLSGVVAAVTIGIYMGWHTPELTTPLMRIQGYAVWEILQFLLNAVLFLLVGLQLPGVIEGLSGQRPGELLRAAALVATVVIGVRYLWLFAVPWLARTLAHRRLRHAGVSDPRERAVLGWCGMRGAVSLAAALAIPLETQGGAAFPERDLVVFLTLAVIVVTLVGQGLTLKPLIRALRVEDDGTAEREELEARRHVADAALERLEEVAGEDWVYDDTIERARGRFDYRRRRFHARLEGDGTQGYEQRSSAYRRLVRELVAAERRRLLELRNQGAISDEVRRRVERDLDFEESGMEE